MIVVVSCEEIYHNRKKTESNFDKRSWRLLSVGLDDSVLNLLIHTSLQRGDLNVKSELSRFNGFTKTVETVPGYQMCNRHLAEARCE